MSYTGLQLQYIAYTTFVVYVLIHCDLFFSVDGKTLLDKVSHMHSITEDDIAGFIRQICEILNEWHTKNVVHLDLRVSRNVEIFLSLYFVRPEV